MEPNTRWTLAELTVEKVLKLLYSRLNDERLSPVAIDKDLLRDLDIIIENALDKAYDYGYDLALYKIKSSEVDTD